jgi:putative DNA methylase
MTEPTTAPTRRKLIEVSLPLEEINRESAREKSIRHGHPSTLHLWWARRPLAAARAVLFAQLVDDPSSHPERFPTPEAQAAERERLHQIVRDLVVWENVNDERLLRRARAEIVASAPDGVPPAILDPFAGGGTIPLEAQRLGLEAHASDLNPVAVLINKALIEIPPKFAGRQPVFPGAAGSRLDGWPRSTGLAEDVRRYGAWMRDRAAERIGRHYPNTTLPDGSHATVLAWIWARTVTCPNPACGIEMPLVRSWWLGKKKGKEAFVVPRVVNDASAPSGRRVAFDIGNDPKLAPATDDDGTMSGRSGARCVACGSSAPMEYIKSEGQSGRLGAALMAVVAEGVRQRIYLAPTEAHRDAASVTRPEDVPDQRLGYDPRNVWTPAYGLTKFADLFTDRQLVALTTFSDLVGEARTQALRDSLAAGMPEGNALEHGGTDAAAYADAIATYLGQAVSRLSSTNSALCRWNSATSKESVTDTFGRQAIPMVWDFAEGNPTAPGPSELFWSVTWVARAIDQLPARGRSDVMQADAASRSFEGVVVSTDPPYYDNIGYSDLSDYFYVWLRRSLRGIHAELMRTVLVPKVEELVANPYRHGGRDGASQFFEDGFERVFARARVAANEDYPITVYYAFKQAELESEGVSSTGWATLLEGMIRSGWTITATWPVRSERSGRMIAVGTNALASSIVLSLRPRHESAQATTRRGFLASLKSRLPQALREMQQGAIAPVDLAQSTIGPGMAVFSSYSKVVEADGTAMSVKTALALINQALDEVLAEQDSDLDADTRFCLKWYAQYGWSEKSFGEADVLARATNTSVNGLARGGVLTSRAGRVRLLPPQDMSAAWDPEADDRVSVWEATMHLSRALDAGGLEAAGALMPRVGERVDLETIQLLAYRLYELTQSIRPSDALLFNALGTSWSDLASVARRSEAARPETQAGFDLDSIDEE